jgi:hypothetical protein
VFIFFGLQPGFPTNKATELVAMWSSRFLQVGKTPKPCLMEETEMDLQGKENGKTVPSLNLGA